MRVGRILLIVFLLLVLLGVSVVMSLQFFRIREVVVEGCSQRDPLMVAELAQVDYEQSIFKLNLRQIRERVDQSPYFEVEDMGLMLPDKLRIRVHERAERAVLQYVGSLLVMDEQGYIIEVRQSLGESLAPIVTGLQVSSFKVGQVIEPVDPKQLTALQVILSELLEQNVTYLISEIDVSDVSSLMMVTTEGFYVELGNINNMPEKIQWLRATLPVVLSEGYSSGILNLSTGKNATFRAAQTAAETPLPLIEESVGDEDGDMPETEQTNDPALELGEDAQNGGETPHTEAEPTQDDENGEEPETEPPAP